MLRFFPLLAVLAALAWATGTELTDLVTWDKYSLSLNGTRTFIFAGEFHYQRLPVPELWPDIFQRFKAHGLNAVSIYFFWSYHSPAPNIYDFSTGPKDVQRLLDAAKAAGLYVIARPGPYCNAESSAGGLPLWLTDGSGGKLRTNDPAYKRAWEQWIRAIGPILSRNQISQGGPIIMVQVENELQQTVYKAEHTLVRYMEDLKLAIRAQGIVVPLTHNEKGMRSISWSTDYQDVGGSVNLYGLDSYPGGLSCKDAKRGFKLVRNYHEWFRNYSYTQPSWLPEFEAGWFQPWGGGLYDDCAKNLGPEFADVYYKNNIAQRVTMMALYMAFGGTSWGHSAAPVVYTSYDYSAPLAETRQIRDKLRQIKLLSLFTNTAVDLLKTDLVGFGRGFANTNPGVWVWQLRNPDTGSGFIVLQQNDSPSRGLTKTSISLQTSEGAIAVSEVALDGRQSKILLTDYHVSNDLTLLYSTVEMLTHTVLDRPVLAMYLRTGQVGEFRFKGDDLPKFSNTGAGQGGKAHRCLASEHCSVLEFTSMRNATARSPLVYMLDVPSAYAFFAPQLPDGRSIFILGPYLVRGASLVGETLELAGDHDLLKESGAAIEAYVGDNRVRNIRWNGRDLVTSRTPYGAITASLPFLPPPTLLPDLSRAAWKTQDSLPEILPSYVDSTWISCNKTTTRAPIKPLTYPVLYSSDYGYYTGIKLYRGRFTLPSQPDTLLPLRLNITASGGEAFGLTAWLNGRHVGGNLGELDPKAESNKRDPDFKRWKHTLSSNLDLTPALTPGENILTVLVDYTGHDQTSVKPGGPANPRGILGASLSAASGAQIAFEQWKIRGAAGQGPNSENNLDPLRGPMNEGGLYGERLGWHIPGVDTSSWPEGAPAEGFKGAGVRWYSTKFPLDLPADWDVPLGVALDAAASVPIRAQIFVNGWQFGKFVAHVGPQKVFPIPPGILNERGNNTLAISLWGMSGEGARLDVRLVELGRYEMGLKIGDTGYLRGGDGGRRREEFA